MRVTENTNFDVMRNSVHRSKGRMEELQMQASSMRKLNKPSDDPVGAAKILEIRTDKTNHQQFQQNAKLAEAFLNNTEQVIQELSEIAMRAKEIAIGQSSGASSNKGTRLGVAEEVGQLIQQAMNSSNRRMGDRYLLGGFRTERPPVNGEGSYQGDDGQVMVEIARDVFITTNLPGLEVFNTVSADSADWRTMQASRMPAEEEQQRTEFLEGNIAEGEVNLNLFNELQRLRIGLLTGDINEIRGTLDNFDQLTSHLVALRSRVGSRLSGLQNTMQALERHDITHSELSSAIEDADMAEVMGNLAKEETVLKSTMQSSTRLVQPTLMDFLR